MKLVPDSHLQLPLVQLPWEEWLRFCRQAGYPNVSQVYLPQELLWRGGESQRGRAIAPGKILCLGQHTPGQILTGKEIGVFLMPWRFWKNGSWAAQVQPAAHKSILSQMLTARECISGKYLSPYFYFWPLWGALDVHAKCWAQGL